MDDDADVSSCSRRPFRSFEECIEEKRGWCLMSSSSMSACLESSRQASSFRTTCHLQSHTFTHITLLCEGKGPLDKLIKESCEEKSGRRWVDQKQSRIKYRLCCLYSFPLSSVEKWRKSHAKLSDKDLLFEMLCQNKMKKCSKSVWVNGLSFRRYKVFHSNILCKSHFNEFFMIPDPSSLQTRKVDISFTAEFFRSIDLN